MAYTDAPGGAQPHRPKNLAFLDAPRTFYAEAFEHRRKEDLAGPMAEWNSTPRSSASLSRTCST